MTMARAMRRALLLAARQRDAALADHRVVALREIGDVLVEARDGRGGHDASHPGVAAIAARSASSGDPVLDAAWRASCASSPKATLSASVSENRNGSCGTKPIAPRSTASGMSRTSTPSMKTVPGGGSCRRASRLISVDLPDPVDADERDRLSGLDLRRDVIEDRRRPP